MQNDKMACGLEGDDEQLAINLSPGSQRALFVIMVGPFFGKSLKHKEKIARCQ